MLGDINLAPTVIHFWGTMESLRDMLTFFMEQLLYELVSAMKPIGWCTGFPRLNFSDFGTEILAPNVQRVGGHHKERSPFISEIGGLQLCVQNPVATSLGDPSFRCTKICH